MAYKLEKKANFSVDLLYELGENYAILVEELLPFYGLTADLAKVQADYHMLAIHSLKDLAVNGNDLMNYFAKKPGSWLKEQLTYLESAVLHRHVSNTKEELLHLAKEKMEK